METLNGVFDIIIINNLNLSVRSLINSEMSADKLSDNIEYEDIHKKLNDWIDTSKNFLKKCSSGTDKFRNFHVFR